MINTLKLNSTTLLLLLLLSAAFLLFSCKGKSETPREDEEKSLQQLAPEAPTRVKVMTLQSVDFENELVNNGKIIAQKVAELKFTRSELIDKIEVKNGQYVAQGEVLAALDTFALHNRLLQAKDNLIRKELDLQDILIGQGYRLDADTAVPDNIMQLARVKSGFNQSETEYKEVERALQQAVLRAPFAGQVANMFSKTHQYANISKEFCLLIDNKSLAVTFSILESELSQVSLGDKVKIRPYAIKDVELEGKISEINPWVKEGGMVQLTATVQSHPQLMAGMNVHISILRSTSKQWVVPKTAVVLRSNREVLFKLVDGKAYWCYVKVGLENANSYTVTGEGLKEGDQVIVEGNINLAHESPVELVSES